MYYRLAYWLEVVDEAIVWHDRALGDKRDAINVVCGVLEKAVPVLRKSIGKVNYVGEEDPRSKSPGP